MRRFRTLEVLAFCACVACIGIVAANGSSKFWVPQNYAFCTSRLPIEREAVKLSRQFAVVLRGESFRNWGYRGANATCCNGTDTVQRSVAHGHALLFEELRALGWNVSVFISTYRCTNGQPLVESLLPQWYRNAGSAYRPLDAPSLPSSLPSPAPQPHHTKALSAVPAGGTGCLARSDERTSARGRRVETRVRTQRRGSGILFAL